MTWIRFRHWLGLCKRPKIFDKYLSDLNKYKNVPGKIIEVEDFHNILHWECLHEKRYEAISQTETAIPEHGEKS